MTSDHAPETEQGGVAGSTTITGRALQQLAVGIARDTAGVSVRDVSVKLSDERGGLRVSVTIPVTLSAHREGTIVEDGDRLRRGIIDGMSTLGGRVVSAVDIQYSGVRRTAERRVR